MHLMVDGPKQTINSCRGILPRVLYVGRMLSINQSWSCHVLVCFGKASLLNSLPEVAFYRPTRSSIA